MSEPQTPASVGIVEYKQWVHLSLRWCWFWVTQCETEEEVLGSGFRVVRVCICGSLAPTWCWCCGWAHTGRCCCWCWGWGCGGSCWALARTSGCSCRWGNRAGVRCPRTPGCRPAGRRTAWSDHERPDSSRPLRTVGGNEAGLMILLILGKF